jgi:hypothetical protein
LPRVWIIFHSSNRVWIIVHSFTTSLVQPGQFCAVGLPKLDCITRVNGVILTNSLGNPVQNFAFQPNDFVSQQFRSLAPVIGTPNPDALSAAEWGGFLSPIRQTVAPDQEVEVMWDVSVVPGTTFQQLADAFTNAGLFGNAEALADGTLLEDHIAFVRPGEIGQGTADMVNKLSRKAMREATKTHGNGNGN